MTAFEPIDFRPFGQAPALQGAAAPNENVIINFVRRGTFLRESSPMTIRRRGLAGAGMGSGI
jgi:hypothetical protein